MNLVNRLKEIRTEKGLTQDALAKEVGVTRQTIIAIEKEKFIPSVKLALLLANVFNRQLEDIFWIEHQ
jgi:putative transcriptional regulator